MMDHTAPLADEHTCGVCSVDDGPTAADLAADPGPNTFPVAIVDESPAREWADGTVAP